MNARPGRIDPGVLLALAAYGLYSTGDALIRSVRGTISVPEIAFFITLFSLVPMLLSRPADERWRDAWRLRHPYALHIRVVSGLTGGFCAIYAFTHLPLAEAYALIFLMPFFVTLFSIVALGEQVGWRRWSALVVGFIGVLIVIRPGFRDVHLAHLAAATVAVTGALTITILRRIARTERRTSIMATVYAYSLVVNGALMAPGFTWPPPQTLATLFAIGCMAGIANLSMIVASQKTEASRIAPTQYSQLVWGVVLGAALFGEFPDRWAWVGLVVVGAAGLFTWLREVARGLWPSRFVFFRNRF